MEDEIASIASIIGASLSGKKSLTATSGPGFSLMNVVQTQSYGISARGGYSEAQVIISSGRIHHPQCDDPDLVLALTQEAYDRYKDKVREECLLDAVSVSGTKGIGFPFAETCLDIGDKRVINVLFLGIVLQNMPVVSQESLLQSIKESLPPKIHEINMKAFHFNQ